MLQNCSISKKIKNRTKCTVEEFIADLEAIPESPQVDGEHYTPQPSPQIQSLIR
jgi:hypothetical protein